MNIFTVPYLYSWILPRKHIFDLFYISWINVWSIVRIRRINSFHNLMMPSWVLFGEGFFPWKFFIFFPWKTYIVRHSVYFIQYILSCHLTYAQFCFAIVGLKLKTVMMLWSLMILPAFIALANRHSW